MASSKERVPVVVVEYDEIARTIATRIAQIIKERRAAGSHAVLGLATGSTPIGIYRELIKTPEGKTRALAIYAKARPFYHPIAVDSVDKLLGGR